MSELSSWKAIAAHLGVSVKTAQAWERERGLPVHRLPGPRGQVWTTADELLVWKASRTADESADDLPPALSPPFPLPVRRLSFVWRWHLLLVVLVVVGVSVFAISHRPRLVSVRVEVDSLLGLDAGGGVLWRRFVGPLNLPAYELGERRSWVGDLDGDGRSEVLFVPVPAGHSGSLLGRKSPQDRSLPFELSVF